MYRLVNLVYSNKISGFEYSCHKIPAAKIPVKHQFVIRLWNNDPLIVEGGADGDNDIIEIKDKAVKQIKEYLSSIE